MTGRFVSDPALTISLALAAGLVAQALAHHARIPGIVLLLLTGAALGPDVLRVVDPASLGSGLHTLVGFAVAVILFEGGLNLDFQRLQRESGTIQRLITIGALITAGGAAVAAHVLMRWDWRSATLFGTLVIVTGPTVVGPLVRRIRLKKSLQTVLEGEGVLIDPVGAIVAVVVLDVALRPSFPSMAIGLLGVVASLGVGSLLGLAGGYGITLLLRRERLIPEGLENVFALSMVLALFHVSNAFQTESGLATVTVAGVVVGNTRHRSLRDLMEFKEQLTVLLIGMLFVILAADVRFDELRRLGVPGLLTVAVLMLVVRPLNISVCTVGSELGARERMLLSWIAPRGIVAAAVASFFTVEMERAGVPGGDELRAMVFLVIAVTVTVQGLTGGFLARLLGVRRQTDRGYGILGASHLGRAVGRALRDGGEEVLFLDSNADASHAAEKDGFRVVFGNALEESTLLRAGIDGLAGCLGLTPNEEVNLLFARKAREEFKVPRAFVALHLREGHVTPKMVQHTGSSVLFGSPKDLSLWESCVRREFGCAERWRYAAPAADNGNGIIPEGEMGGVLLPMVVIRGDRAVPFDDARRRKGDLGVFLVFRPKRDLAAEWLSARGWEPDTPEAEAGE